VLWDSALHAEHLLLAWEFILDRGWGGACLVLALFGREF